MKNSAKAIEVFYLDDKRNAQWYQSNTNWRHKKFSWTGKRCGTMKYWSLVVQLSCSCRFCWISHQLHLNSLCLSVPTCDSRLWLFLIRRSTLKNSSTKWQSPGRIDALHRIIVLFSQMELIERSVLVIHCDSWRISLFISPSVPLRPSVDLRPPSYYFILSLRLTMPAVFFWAAVWDTIPEGILSWCWCSLTQTLTTSIGIRHSEGATKGVTSPTVHRDIWHVAGATKSWLHCAIFKKSFALIKNASRQPKFSIWMIRETLRDDSQIRIGDTKKLILMTERYGAGAREC